MTQYKFRGKRKDNNEWAYGLLVMGVFNDTMIQIKENGFYHTLVVYPDTVGMWTTMKDKKVADIYEGDIVQFILSEALDYDVDYDYEKYGSKPQTAVVRWSDDAYGFRMNFGSRFKICPEMIEVVGNIHEHPHLLTPAERTA